MRVFAAVAADLRVVFDFHDLQISAFYFVLADVVLENDLKQLAPLDTVVYVYAALRQICRSFVLYGVRTAIGGPVWKTADLSGDVRVQSAEMRAFFRLVARHVVGVDHFRRIFRAVWLTLPQFSVIVVLRHRALAAVFVLAVLVLAGGVVEVLRVVHVALFDAADAADVSRDVCYARDIRACLARAVLFRAHGEVLYSCSIREQAVKREPVRVGVVRAVSGEGVFQAEAVPVQSQSIVRAALDALVVLRIVPVSRLIVGAAFVRLVLPRARTNTVYGARGAIREDGKVLLRISATVRNTSLTVDGSVLVRWAKTAAVESCCV